MRRVLTFADISERLKKKTKNSKRNHSVKNTVSISVVRFVISIKPMKTISLTQGEVAIVDDEDFENLNKFNWQAKKCKTHDIIYAVRAVKRKEKKMHREILKANPSEEVDHIDGNGLNNVRSILRECSHQQNMCNQKKSSNNTSGYKGVSWDKNAWRVRIRLNNKEIYIGSFKNIKDAALAYDVAAQIFFGEFARTNSSITKY